MRTKKRMSALLPPTPCTPEMREQMVMIAGMQGRSIADIQRDAISLFLSNIGSKTINNDNLIVETAEAQPA